ncbi:MAG: sigma-70 family RNA polymerase sigma factor [Armatimonadota bacterium]|nr:sigma-70 family RNA polymerase sigma factor [Armatimonadota bacterium]
MVRPDPSALAEGDAHALFRRALAFRDEDAWRTLYARYEALVAAWVRRHPGFLRTGEPVEFFVNRAFEKMLAAVDEHKFTRFPDVPSLLRYLKMCAHSAIVDVLRRREETLLADDPPPGSVPDVETLAVRNLEREELWEAILSVLADERDRALVYESFVNGASPRQILARLPGLFDSVESIYTTKRNILARLRRHPKIRAFRA